MIFEDWHFGWEASVRVSHRISGPLWVLLNREEYHLDQRGYLRASEAFALIPGSDPANAQGRFSRLSSGHHTSFSATCRRPSENAHRRPIGNRGTFSIWPGELPAGGQAKRPTLATVARRIPGRTRPSQHRPQTRSGSRLEGAMSATQVLGHPGGL